MSVNIFLEGSPSHKKFEEYSAFLERQRPPKGQTRLTENQQRDMVNMFLAATREGGSAGHLNRISAKSPTLEKVFGFDVYSYLFGPEYKYGEGWESKTVSEFNGATFINRVLALFKKLPAETPRDIHQEKDAVVILNELIAFGVLAHKMTAGRKNKKLVAMYC